MDKDKVKISYHAIKKFQKLSSNCRATDNIEQKIRSLFNKAKEETPDQNPGLVKRIIDNNFQETFYFKFNKWRFVVCNNVMVTIEKDVFGYCGEGYLKK